jgi:hypothetical protein
MIRVAILMAGLLAVATAAVAQLPSVQVEFHIVDPTFHRELGARLSAAETAFGPILIEELHQRIGFLKFSGTPAPVGQQAYRLVISLGDPNAGSIRDVRFNLTLLPPPGVNLTGRAAVSWLFRKSDESFRPLSRKQNADEKIRDVDLVGGDGQPGELRRQFSLGDFSRLVSDVLSRIPIAADASLQMGTDPKWSLPLHRGETCMDLRTRFRIAHLLQEDGASEELPLEVEATGPPDGATDALLGRIIARVPDSPLQTRSIGRLGDPSVRQVKVTAVFVTQYLRRSVCSDAPLPTDAGVGGGSQ